MRTTRLISCVVMLASFFTPISASYAQSGTKTITVFAASSLTRVFNALGAKFQIAHSGVTVRFSYGSSATLATQINAGAPADIFASADVASMKSVLAEVPKPIDYVINEVVIAVPKNSKINKVSDLNGGTQWLQCAHSVPCGIAADGALKIEGSVTTSPVSLESTDANAVAKLLAGSVDAAIVYKTDVIANPTKLKAITFSNSAAASTQYQLGISNLSLAKNRHWAQTFFRYLNGHDARKFLFASGFTISQ